MPRLKKLFGRGNELEPLQYKYLTKFQAFLEQRNPDLHKRLQDVHANAHSGYRAEMLNWVAANYLTRLTGETDANAQEWRGMCLTIQWLGTEEGQKFLASVNDANI
jgi:hypothetical protein